jgi:two-component system, OmpR family, response regulator
MVTHRGGQAEQREEYQMEKTILIVDDEKEWIQILGMRLAREGYHIEAGFDALQAVARAVQLRPHLVLLDIMMPGGGGFVALKNIRANAKVFGVPVIVVSARGDKEARDTAESLGVSGFFVKPVHMRKFTNRIAQVLRN